MRRKKYSCWLEYTTEEKKKSEDFRFDPRDLWNLKRYHGIIIFTVSIRQKIQTNSINPRKDACSRNVHICPGRFSGTEKRKLDNLIDNISILLESSTISDIHQAFSILHVQNELQPKILEQLNFHSSF